MSLFDKAAGCEHNSGVLLPSGASWSAGADGQRSVANSNDSGVLSGRGGTGEGGLPGRKTGNTPSHRLMLWFEYLLYRINNINKQY